MDADDQSGADAPAPHAGVGQLVPPVEGEAGAVAAEADVARVSEPTSGSPPEAAAVVEAAAREAPVARLVSPARRSLVAPALIPMDRIDDDATFQLREVGDLALLATDLARLGQLYPVELRLKPPDRFQVVSGFRRVAALRFLQRDKVLARLHTDLSDEDALLMALAAAIHTAPVSREELGAIQQRLEQERRLSPAARDMLGKALATEDELAPESVEEEVDADELADDVTARLAEVNQDLALLADVFKALDEGRREELLRQLRYAVDLVAYLERQ